MTALTLTSDEADDHAETYCDQSTKQGVVHVSHEVNRGYEVPENKCIISFYYYFSNKYYVNTINNIRLIVVCFSTY